jgi:hypothetical protein
MSNNNNNNNKNQYSIKPPTFNGEKLNTGKIELKASF